MYYISVAVDEHIGSAPSMTTRDHAHLTISGETLIGALRQIQSMLDVMMAIDLPTRKESVIQS
jgi:hypothetical protein